MTNNIILSLTTLGFSNPEEKYKIYLDKLKSNNMTYHNEKHVLNLLNSYGNFENQSKEIIAAIWFHDIVYDPKRTDNEERSAEYAHDELVGLDIDRSKVLDIILDTKDHLGGDPDLDTFNDLDLCVLSLREYFKPSYRSYFSGWYKEYALQIRQEYSFVPLPDYIQGRLNFLKSFENKQIFKTSGFKYLEIFAHLNIEEEIFELKNNPKTFDV